MPERVTQDAVASVVARMTGVPLRSLLRGERERLLHVEDVLRQRIIGQDEALSAIGDAVRLSRAGLSNERRPLASFIFAGATGCGKSETCKALAEYLFDDASVVQINCSELGESHSASRLIGAPPGYVGHEDAGQLTEAVRRRPYSIVLFDEIEKASRPVQMLLLQILEEGALTDSQGRRVDFRNTIVVLTSNLGAGGLYEPGAIDEAGKVTATGRADVMSAIQDAMPPELLNRLDDILIFNRLQRASIRGIVDIRLKELAQRLAPRRIVLDVDQAAKDWLAEAGFDAAYGARPLARAIQRNLLNRKLHMSLSCCPRCSHSCPAQPSRAHSSRAPSATATRCRSPCRTASCTFPSCTSRKAIARLPALRLSRSSRRSSAVPRTWPHLTSPPDLHHRIVPTPSTCTTCTCCPASPHASYHHLYPSYPTTHLECKSAMRMSCHRAQGQVAQRDRPGARDLIIGRRGRT